MPDPTLGSRHRAAVGLSKECDAVVIVVSEETGYIRIAERGRLSEPLTVDELRRQIEVRLTRSLRAKKSQPAAAEEPHHHDDAATVQGDH
jgi:diadenylate cyclase